LPDKGTSRARKIEWNDTLFNGCMLSIGTNKIELGNNSSGNKFQSVKSGPQTISIYNKKGENIFLDKVQFDDQRNYTLFITGKPDGEKDQLPSVKVIAN